MVVISGCKRAREREKDMHEFSLAHSFYRCFKKTMSNY